MSVFEGRPIDELAALIDQTRDMVARLPPGAELERRGFVSAIQTMTERLMRHAKAIDLLNAMSREDRLAVFGEFCVHCGGDDPHCYCMRDD